jgi:hypothetical protein
LVLLGLKQERSRSHVVRALRAIVLALFVWMAFRPAPAAAQSAADLTHARELYSQGLSEEAAGDWAGGLKTFEQVARVKLTPQVRFHIARCQENLGRLNAALGGYRMAEYEAQQRGESQELIDQIHSASQALTKRIPRLVITRGRGAEDIQVEVDGVSVGGAELGRPMRVDPGPHEIVGVLSNGSQFKQSVTATEGKTVHVTLDVPEKLGKPSSGAAPSAPPAAPSSEPPVSDNPPSPQAEDKSAASSSSSIVPWVIGGFGVASLAAAGGFYLARNSEKNKLDQSCLGNKCPDTLKSTEDAGKLYSMLTGVALGVGVAAVGTSLVWLLTRKHGSEKHSEDDAGASPAFDVAVSALPQSAGVSVAGHF